MGHFMRIFSIDVCMPVHSVHTYAVFERGMMRMRAGDRTVKNRGFRKGTEASERGVVIGQSFITFASRGGLFLPGMFFVIIGLTTVVAPRLLVSVLASFFLFVGFLLCMLAWKVMGWRHRLEKFARGIEGKIVVQAPSNQSGPRDPFEALKNAAAPEPEIGKKIVIH
jgi:hypothetical protein